MILKKIYQTELNISDRAVRAYASSVKIGLDTSYLPLEHPPGSQADFGAAQFIKGQHDGPILTYRFHTVMQDFSYSKETRMPVARIKDICEFIEAAQCTVDNMPTAVNEIANKAKET